eukprot:190831-Chlamydomonas_euryale.AAC.1
MNAHGLPRAHARSAWTAAGGLLRGGHLPIPHPGACGTLCPFHTLEPVAPLADCCHQEVP